MKKKEKMWVVDINYGRYEIFPEENTKDMFYWLERLSRGGACRRIVIELEDVNEAPWGKIWKIN